MILGVLCNWHTCSPMSHQPVLKPLGSKICLLTDRVRSTRGGYIFSLSVNSHLREGYPIPGPDGGVPHPRSTGGTPSQVQVGGYPILGPGRGVPAQGIPPPPGREAPTWGTPHLTGGACPGYPPVWQGMPTWQGGTHLGYPPTWQGVPAWGTPLFGRGRPPGVPPTWQGGTHLGYPPPDRGACLRYPPPVWQGAPTQGTPLSGRGAPTWGTPPPGRGAPAWANLPAWQGAPTQGTPPPAGAALRVLAMWRSVCLLRSRRRTFLFVQFFTELQNKKKPISIDSLSGTAERSNLQW